MGILFFIIIFCVIVVAHEFGHFIVAKANGIHVVEFTVGMGPSLFHFDKNGTRYSLRLLPLGGACIFEGEDGLNNAADDEDGETTNSDSDKTHLVEVVVGDNTEQVAVSAEKKQCENKPVVVETAQEKEFAGAFPDAPVYARIATVLAGPMFNFILAFLLAMIIVGSIGSDLPIVGAISEGGGAEAAGMLAGDEIVKIDGKSIHLFREISLIALLNEGEDLAVTYKRDGQLYDCIVTPTYSPEANRYYLGVVMQAGYTKFDALGTIQYSFYEVKYWVDTTIKSLGMLGKGEASVKDLSGPVGMADTVDEIYTESKSDGAYYVWLNMVNFTILLSANLGVLNLIPFPALDGGRLFLLLIEAVRRKPIPPEKEGIVNAIGFTLLMLLMAVVMYNDIVKLFQ